MLQHLPSDMEFLPEQEFVRLIMTVPEVTRWHQTTTPLTFGKRGRVLLQDPETTPPPLVLTVKMVPHAVPGLL